MAKKRKKRKLKVTRIFLAFFIIAIITYLLYLLIQIPTKAYYIKNNTYYTDQEILDKLGLNKYPSFLLTNSYSLTRKVKNDDLIQKIKEKKNLNGTIQITVIENKILFYDDIKKKSILENGKKIDYYDEKSPVLVNEIDNKKVYNNFLVKLNKLDDNIIKNISEIKYEPNEIDKERFLFSMNDGNYVYLTLSKFTNINNYLEISTTLGDKNGILYLDYGNYFVPKE